MVGTGYTPVARAAATPLVGGFYLPALTPLARLPSPARMSIRRLVPALLLVAPALALAATQPHATDDRRAPIATSTAAEARAHDVDRAHSEINFTASSRLLDAHGFFGAWDADIQLDPQAFERSTVTLTIDAASINTRIGRRDAHLKGPDFFDTARYPTITFVSKSIARTGATAGVITGDLTMRGVTRSVQVPVTVVFYEKGRGRFRGAFTVNRKDYGISYDSKVNPIADAVEVQFNMSVVERKG